MDPRFYYSDPSRKIKWILFKENNNHNHYFNIKTKDNITEDKDSLSVRVAYIKVNISRTRRVTTFNDLRTLKSSSSNDVRLSVLADIGSSSFIYDLRNIKEVFVFPKIWYRRSLARRLFLGEESVIHEDTSETREKTNVNTPLPNILNENKNVKSQELKRRNN